MNISCVNVCKLNLIQSNTLVFSYFTFDVIAQPKNSSRPFLHGMQPSIEQRGRSFRLPSSNPKHPNPFTSCSKAPVTPRAVQNHQIKMSQVGISKPSQNHQTPSAMPLPVTAMQIIKWERKREKDNGKEKAVPIQSINFSLMLSQELVLLLVSRELLASPCCLLSTVVYLERLSLSSQD